MEEKKTLVRLPQDRYDEVLNIKIIKIFNLINKIEVRSAEKGLRNDLALAPRFLQINFNLACMYKLWFLCQKHTV